MQDVEEAEDDDEKDEDNEEGEGGGTGFSFLWSEEHNGGWERVFDKRYETYYYTHPEYETTWERPSEFVDSSGEEDGGNIGGDERDKEAD